MAGSMDLGGTGIQAVIKRTSSTEESLSDTEPSLAGDLVLPTQDLVSQVKGLEGFRKKLPDLSTLSNLRPGARREQRIVRGVEDRAALEEAERLAQISLDNLIQEEARVQTQAEKDLFDTRLAEQSIDLTLREELDLAQRLTFPSNKVEPEKEKGNQEQKLLNPSEEQPRGPKVSEAQTPIERKTNPFQPRAGLFKHKNTITTRFLLLVLKLLSLTSKILRHLILDLSHQEHHLTNSSTPL